LDRLLVWEFDLTICCFKIWLRDLPRARSLAGRAVLGEILLDCAWEDSFYAALSPLLGFLATKV